MTFGAWRRARREWMLARMPTVLRRPWTTLLGRSALAVGLSLSAVGCSDGTGYTVLALNESDQDVIVGVARTHDSESRRLPARTWGTLFISNRLPSGELIVFDESCGQIASFPFTQSSLTVHVDPDGDVTSSDDDWKVPAGVEYRSRDGGEAERFPMASCP